MMRHRLKISETAAASEVVEMYIPTSLPRTYGLF